MRNKIIIPVVIIFLAIGAYTIITLNGGFSGHRHKHSTDNVTVITPELLSETLDGDIVYGQKDAPIKIVEYASLSCSHCASFYTEVFGYLKDDYVSAGKLTLTYRHFPTNALALKAALLVGCVADDTTKKNFLAQLFSRQKTWTSSSNNISELRTIANNFGINAETFNDCVNNNEAKKIIVSHSLRAKQELSVRSTPSLFINGEYYSGEKSYIALAAYIDKILRSKYGKAPEMQNDHGHEH